jgi:hypothetical protein
VLYLIISLGSVAVAIGCLLYARKQTAYARQQTNIATTLAAKQADEEREVHEWQVKHEAIANQVVKVGPQTMVPEPGYNSFMGLYCDVFSDVVLRQAIENYIVELVENRTRFVQRKPTPHELRGENLRSTVTKAAQLLDAYRKNKPEIAAKFIPFEKRDSEAPKD